MQVSVVRVNPEGVELKAPLEPNINHRETVFGGSASAVAILSAWSLVRNRLGAEGIECKIVIHKNSMSYDKPIDGEFRALSSLAEGSDWPRFIRTLQEKGKARIGVDSVLMFKGEIVGRFEGRFVALI